MDKEKIEQRIEMLTQGLKDSHGLGRQRPDGTYFFRLTRAAREREIIALTKELKGNEQ